MLAADGRPVTRRFTRPEHRHYSSSVQEQCRLAMSSPADGYEDPWCVDLTAVFQRPKSHFTSKGALKSGAPSCPQGKPDLDNIAKIACDALNGMLWRDDAQVIALHVQKLYGDRPGLSVRAWNPKPGVLP